MHHDFDDIRSRITDAPAWFDSNGTPRYCEFAPEACPNIYADEVALVEIACQQCGERFMVEIHSYLTQDRWTLASQISAGLIHYGDPPAHGCVGDAMNCLDLRVVQYWHHQEGAVMKNWERVSDLEVEMPAAKEEC